MNDINVFFSPNQNGNSALKIFCFPFAGGGISTYLPWGKLLEANVELQCLQLPGRGARISENPHDDMESLIAEVLPEIVSLIDKPYIFVGYSLGAKVAYELMVRLSAIGFPLPLHFIAIASPAPHIIRRTLPIHQLSDEKFVERLANYEGTPPELLSDPEVMQLLLPALRADFSILENYHCSYKNKWPTALSIFGGMDDKDVAQEDLLAWSSLFESVNDPILFPGGHFFIKKSEGMLISAVNEICIKELDSISPSINI